MYRPDGRSVKPAGRRRWRRFDHDENARRRDMSDRYNHFVLRNGILADDLTKRRNERAKLLL